MPKASFFTTWLLIFLLLPSTVAFAEKVDRLQDELEDSRKDLRSKTAEISRARSELAKAESELTQAKARLEAGKRRFPDPAKITEEENRKLEELRGHVMDAQVVRDEARAKLDIVSGEADALKEETKRIQRRIDKAEDAEARAKDCVDCGSKGAQPKHQVKSGWDGVANVIKAVTPLGVGAMGLYGGIKAMDKQSSDYQLYANTMAQNGLPFAQNSNSYSGIMSSFFGSSMMSSMMMSGSGGNFLGMGGMNGMSGFGFGGFGSGYGGGFGMMGGMNLLGGLGYGNMMGGFNPYASMLGSYNPYGSALSSMNPYAAMMGSYNPYGAMMGYGSALSAYNPYAGSMNAYGSYGYNPYGYNSYAYGQGSGYGNYSYNPWSSNTASYNSSIYSAQLRQQQQSSIYSTDLQVAGAGYQESLMRYQQALQGSYGGGYYGSGYYGSGVLYPSYYNSLYNYGTSGTPALNSTRQ